MKWSPHLPIEGARSGSWRQIELEILQKMKSLVLLWLLAVMVVGEEGESKDLAR